MPDAPVIAYPLSMPEGNIANLVFTTESSQQVSEAPRSLARSVVDWGGERWRVQATVQRGTYVDTARWRAFFVRMRGSVGTFLLNPYGAGGAGQTGEWNSANEHTGGLPPISVKAEQRIDDHRITLTTSLRLDDAFKAGDFIQIGQGSNARLHMILDDVSLTSADTTINIWPRARADASGEIVVEDPRGVFYFRDPTASWTRDNLWHHEISFTAYST